MGALLVLPLGAAPARKVIVDTDMGLDDIRAIAALLAAPDVRILAFTVVEGSSSVERGTENLLSLLDALGAPSIPVAKGKTLGLAAPPWRGVAESMGGLKLESPKRKALDVPAPELITDLIKKNQDGMVDILCLGPLTNVALALEGKSDLQRQVNSIWILGGTAGDPVYDFNLAFDPDSTGKVFRLYSPLIFVPEALCREVQADCAWFGKLGKASEGASKLLGRMRCSEEHFRLIDEVLAAIYCGEALATVRTAEKGMALDREGKTVYEGRRFAIPREVVVRISAGEVQAMLEKLWTAAPAGSSSASEPDPLVLIRALHGHLGPYVVLGYRMGRLALKETASSGYFDLEARVRTKPEPPESCLVDGVQLGSGCTLGKGNIHVEESKSPAAGLFKNKEGKQVEIALREDLPGKIKTWIDELGVEKAGLKIFGLPDEELFRVRKPSP
jgi:inosine-uridine nucleoside N-ribohydrolase